MSTIFQAFPGLPNVETAAQVFPVAVRFTAPLVGGFFEFNQIENFAFQGQNGEKFALDGLTLAANIDTLTFSNAVDPAYNNGFFALDVLRAGNRHACTMAPFKFTAFNQGTEYNANWEPTATTNNGENFLFRLNGRLVQTPALIAAGLVSVSIIVTANIYRIKARTLKNG